MRNGHFSVPPDDPTTDVALVKRVKQVLEEQPLFARLQLPGIVFRAMIQPPMVELVCPNCGTTRPFRETSGQRGPGIGSGSAGGATSLTSKVYTYEFACTGCQQATASFFVEVYVDTLDPLGNSNWLRKVGQVPPWSIAIPADLRKELGDDAAFYERALVCLSQSYGLAACAYLRRVLENHINPLLQLIHDVRKGDGAPESELKALTEALRSKVFDQKLQVAYKFAPPSIVVDGMNPLKLIHDQLSIGIHTLGENECTEIALKLRTALAFVLRELRRQRDSREVFVRDLKEASKPKRRNRS